MTNESATKGGQKPATKKESKATKSILPEVPLLRLPTFEKKYATRAVPFFTEFDIRINLSNEQMKDEKDWVAVVDEMIILTPTAAKELRQALTSVIDEWEKVNGKIKERSTQKLITTYTRKE